MNKSTSCFTGKTTISKEKAIRLARAGKKVVFYISLAATDFRGRAQKHSFILDIATKMEMQGKCVHVVDAIDLKQRYEMLHPTQDSSEVNIYDIVLSFIEQNSDADIFLDEVPIIATNFHCILH